MRSHRHPTFRQLTLFLVALLVPAIAAGAASAQIARVNATAGEVVLVRDGARAALANDAALLADDEIVTGRDGRAEVVFGDGSTLVIGSESRIILRQFDIAAGGGRTGLLDLLEGIARMALRPGPDSRVDISTRTAIASVRSTEWIVEAKPDTSAVFVITGQVDVTGNGVPGHVVLGPGEGTDVKANMAPSTPKAWGIGRVRQVFERTQRP